MNIDPFKDSIVYYTYESKGKFLPKSATPGGVQVKTRQGQNPDRVRRATRIFIGQGRFSEARAQSLFIFQINSDKIWTHVVILDIRGLKVCNIFNGTTMVGAV